MPLIQEASHLRTTDTNPSQETLVPLGPIIATTRSESPSTARSTHRARLPKRFSALDPFCNPDNPLSPFYTHPPSRRSLDEISPSSTRVSFPVFEVGSAGTQSLATLDAAHLSRPSTGHDSSHDSSHKKHALRNTRAWTGRDSDVEGGEGWDSQWPSRKELEQRRKQQYVQECRRNWNPFGGRLSSIKAKVVLFVVSLLVIAMLGLGLGLGLSQGLRKKEGKPL